MNQKKAKALRRETRAEMSQNKDAPIKELVIRRNGVVINDPYSHAAFYNAMKKSYKVMKSHGAV